MEDDDMTNRKTMLFEPSYSVADFCFCECISKGWLYELWSQGRGPKFYWDGRFRRITHRARLQWQRMMEAEAEAEADAAADARAGVEAEAGS